MENEKLPNEKRPSCRRRNICIAHVLSTFIMTITVASSAWEISSVFDRREKGKRQGMRKTHENEKEKMLKERNECYFVVDINCLFQNIRNCIRFAWTETTKTWSFIKCNKTNVPSLALIAINPFHSALHFKFIFTSSFCLCSSIFIFICRRFFFAATDVVNDVGNDEPCEFTSHRHTRHK